MSKRKLHMEEVVPFSNYSKNKVTDSDMDAFGRFNKNVSTSFLSIFVTYIGVGSVALGIYLITCLFECWIELKVARVTTCDMHF